jgi:hypothetical protein
VALAAPPADAWDGTQYGVTMKLAPDTVKELTDGRNHIAATGAADERVWGDAVVLSFPVRSAARQTDDSVLRLAGGISYTGAGPDVTWTRLRLDFATDVVSARVNGGDRAPVLRVRAHTWRTSWGTDDRTLVLTRAGARSLNRAAAGSPFRAGDVFAGDSTGCGG